MQIQLFGHSMSPLIKDGDTIVINPFTEPRAVKRSDIGKILIYKDEHEWVSHRVIESKKQLYYKGDFSYHLELTSNYFAWGEVIAAQSKNKNKNIKTHFFAKFIAKISYLQCTAHSQEIKKLLKTFIYCLNFMARYIKGCCS